MLSPVENFVPRRGEVVDEVGDGLVLGHRLMAAGEFELALRSYTEALGRDGINADVLSAIGSANLRLGRLNQAERFLRKAVELDETFVPAWNNLGVTLLSLRKNAEAREVLRLAFALDSGNSVEIRDNLRLAMAQAQNIESPAPEISDFRLVRRGNGRYLLLGN